MIRTVTFRSGIFRTVIRTVTGALMLACWVPALCCAAGTQADQESPPASPSAWPMGGACIHSLHPASILAALDAFSLQTDSKPDLWWDLQKNMKRRFNAETHIPFQKGFVFFFGPDGLMRLDFEYVLDDVGVAQALLEYSQQWIAPHPMKHPNYEVRTEDLGGGQWTVHVDTLSWRPVFPNEFNGEVTYEKHVNPSFFRTHFRKAGPFLWYSYRREWLDIAAVDRVPQQFLNPQESAEGRVATVWFDPDAIPEQLRTAWFEETRTQLAPALQAQDGEYDAATVVRQTALLAKTELLRCAMFDVHNTFLHLDILDGQVKLHGTAQLKPGSAGSEWIRLMAPRLSTHTLEHSLTDACQFRITGRIPAVQLHARGTELKPAEDGGSFDVTGELSLDSTAHSNGRLLLHVSDSLAEGLAGVAQRVMVNLNVLLQGLHMFQEDPPAAPSLARIVPDPTGASAMTVAWGALIDDIPDAQTEETALNHARAEIHAEYSFLKNLRVFLKRAGRVPGAQYVPGDPNFAAASPPPEDLHLSEGVSIRLDLRPRQIDLKASASVPATFELLATLVGLGFRI